MTFASRGIIVRLKLANGQFQGGGNSADLTGLRTRAIIEETGAPSMSTAQVTVYGMPLDQMNQLATIGAQYNARYKNGLDILAGDEDSGMSLVFSGIIYNAYVDGSDPKNMALQIVAAPGAFLAVQPSAPLALSGGQDVSGLMKQLAGQMGLTFEDNGVKVKLASPYYAGTAWQRMLNIAGDAGIDVVVTRGTLVISPRGVPRKKQTVTLAPGAGLVGYPSFVQNSVVAKGEFDPAAAILGTLDLQSSLQGATGKWQIRKITHYLEAQVPGGQWFMVLETNPLGTT